MPIYMDRHDVSEEVTAEIVAQLHQQDLKIQHHYSCRGLTYWFDDRRKTAFCLIEAPQKKNIIEMHSDAHGDVPHRVIEVDESIVESFLGRIEDPEKSKNKKLNIINDPAFRIIMVIDVLGHLRLSKKVKDTEVLRNREIIMSNIKKFHRGLVKKESLYYLISFESVTNAVQFAIHILHQFKKHINQNVLSLNIGLCAGVPVTDKDEEIFIETINRAKRLSRIVHGEIVITQEVQQLFESENLNQSLKKYSIRSVTIEEESILEKIMLLVENNWDNGNIKLKTYSSELGYSNSKLYRKIKSLLGESFIFFLVKYRLKKALSLLKEQSLTIAEVAFKTGFNSPSYFTRCFIKYYGISPSQYLQLVK